MEKHEVYDPHFGDFKKCVCGHVYYYHFNPHTGKPYLCSGARDSECGCKRFQEKKSTNQLQMR